MIEWNINGSPPAGERIPVTLSAEDHAALSRGDIVMWLDGDFISSGAISGGLTEMLFIKAGNISEGTLHPDRLPAIDASKLTGTIDYARLPPLNISGGGSMPPYISSITPITPNGVQEITILGEYFSPITQLSIPGVVVNNLEVRSPNKIVANISKSGLIGDIPISLSNGANTNLLWAEGIKSVPVFSDPYLDYVSLFIKGDGENNSINIIDISPSPKNITREGNVKISTAQSKYGGSSIYFDGTGDYLTTPATGTLNFTTQDFTWEGWLFFDTLPGTTLMVVFSTARADAGGNFGHLLVVTNSEFRLRDWAGGPGPFFSVSIAINTWYHVACTKKGSVGKIWVNGIKGSNGPIASTNVPYTKFMIGSSYNTGGYAVSFRGYMDMIRITTGVERYSDNFNPETDTFLNI